MGRIDLGRRWLRVIPRDDRCRTGGFLGKETFHQFSSRSIIGFGPRLDGPISHNARGGRRCQDRSKQPRADQDRHGQHMGQESTGTQMSRIGTFHSRFTRRLVRMCVFVQNIPPHPRPSPDQDTRHGNGIQGSKAIDLEASGQLFRFRILGEFFTFGHQSLRRRHSCHAQSETRQCTLGRVSRK